MNRTRCFSIASAECVSSDRVAAIRARTLYRDTLNFAAGGGIKMKHTNNRGGAIYAGPITVRGKCMGQGLDTTAPAPAECAAFYIHSASSYRDLLDITRGIFAGHAEEHPEAIIAAFIPHTVPPNSDSIRNVLQFSNDMPPHPYRYNRLPVLNDFQAANLLILSGSGGSNSNAMYDAAVQAARPVDPLSCVQFPPNPNLSIAYGGGGCLI